MFSNMQTLLAVLLIGLVAPSIAETQITAPLIAWSSQEHFASRDGSQRHVETRQVTIRLCQPTLTQVQGCLILSARRVDAGSRQSACCP